MSRSYRKAIIKDSSLRRNRRMYLLINRIIRRREKSYMYLLDTDDSYIPDRKHLFNIWNYFDNSRFNIEHLYSNKQKLEQDNIDHINKYRRK